MRKMFFFINILFLFLFNSLGSMAAPLDTISVTGKLFNRPFYASVNHCLAEAMLTNPTDSNVLRLYADYNSRELNTEILSEISEKYSAHVSTLFFVEKMYEQDKNRQAQDYYLSVIDSLLNGEHTQQQLSFLRNYFIVFVPGFRYRMVNNGGNFLNQRQLLDSAGIPYEMISINESGLVEENSRLIVERLRKLNSLYRNIIIISVSKGGLETAIALGKQAKPEDIASVKAWINVGGILKGTPIADIWGRPFKRFWLWCGLHFVRQKVDMKALTHDMSYNRCKEVYKDLKIPDGITTVNLVAVSLEQQEEHEGIPVPNDGFSPLADTVAENGVVVIEMGANHFFKDLDMNIRMVALLHYIVNQLENS